MFRWKLEGFTAYLLVAASLARVKSYLPWRPCLLLARLAISQYSTMIIRLISPEVPALTQSSEVSAASTLTLCRVKLQFVGGVPSSSSQL